MIDTVKEFITQHSAQLTDYAFVAGYISALAALTLLLLFFMFLYLKKNGGRYIYKPHHRPEKILSTIIDVFLEAFIVYAAYTAGIETAFTESVQLFKVMPAFIFAFCIIPVYIVAHFLSFIVIDIVVKTRPGRKFVKFLNNILKTKGGVPDADIERDYICSSDVYCSDLDVCNSVVGCNLFDKAGSDRGGK